MVLLLMQSLLVPACSGCLVSEYTSDIKYPVIRMIDDSMSGDGEAEKYTCLSNLKQMIGFADPWGYMVVIC
jgi:hypothetical protein